MIPVFVGGCDRSGTTFLGSVIGGHSNCITVPEFQFKLDLLQLSGGSADKMDLQKALSLLQRDWRFRIWSVPDREVLRRIEFFEGCSPRDLIETIVAVYGEATGKTDFYYWVDHTPSNMQNAIQLLRTFPTARFIHIIRDGRAVAASVIPLAWGPHAVNRAAHWWLEKIAFGLAAELALSSEQIIRVRYEDLVLDTVATSKRICAFLGIDYQPDMVEGTGFKVSAYTRNQHALVGRRPNVDRVSAWTRNLTARDIEIFEGIAGGLLETLGYTSHNASVSPISHLERLRFATIDLYRTQLAGRIQQWRRRAGIKRILDEHTD